MDLATVASIPLATEARGGSRSSGKRNQNKAALWTASQAATMTGKSSEGQPKWKPVVNYLVESDLTLIMIFWFSKKKCKTAIESHANVDLLPDKTGKAKVHQLLETAM